MSYDHETVRPEARLIILKALAAQPDERLNSSMIGDELFRLGIDRERTWIHGELDWLAEMGAVTLTRVGTVVVATLTEKGARHLRRAIVIEGIRRPGRPGE